MTQRARLHVVLSITSVIGLVAHADDWPQWQGPRRNGTWNETGIVQKFPKEGPKILWRANVAGGYSGPIVAGGKVFVTDFVGEGDKSNDPGRRNELHGVERVLCLDAQTGAEVWKHTYPCDYKLSYPAGPRAAPAVSDGHVYTLGAEGNLFCLEADTGKVVWSKQLKSEYKTGSPIWGFSAHPLIDGDRLYCLVGGEGSLVVSFDKRSGKEIWKALTSEESGYSAPSIIEAGGVRQLVMWAPDSIHGLELETGKSLWSAPLKPAYGMSIMSPVKAGNLLYAGGIGDQSLLLKLGEDKPTAEEVWRGTSKSSLYSVCSPPIVDGDHLYGASQNGEFFAVKIATGDRLWNTAKPTTGGRRADSAACYVVRNNNQYVLFAETGHLILAKLTPDKYTEVDRFKLLEPTNECFGRPVVWSHPAFANKAVYARNDKEIVCASLAAD